MITKYYQIDYIIDSFEETYLNNYNISGNMCQYVGNRITFDLATGKN